MVEGFLVSGFRFLNPNPHVHGFVCRDPGLGLDTQNPSWPQVPYTFRV